MAAGSDAPQDQWCTPNGQMSGSAHNTPIPHLSLSGTLDVTTGEDCADFVQHTGIDHDGWLLIDASGLKMVTSSGAGVLIRLASQKAEAGGGLVLVVPPGEVANVIRFMRLDLVIDTFGALDEAVKFILEPTVVVTEPIQEAEAPAPTDTTEQA